MRFAVIVLAMGMLSPATDDAAIDLKNMEGTWILVSGEENGKPISEQTMKASRLEIKGDKHNVKVGDDTFVGTHKIDPSKKPKTIDASDTDGKFKGKTSLGIYEIKGDEFKVCFAAPEKDRPKEFTTKSGTGTMVHVWKRTKK
jgi:uncharacterized protein (TIGR03067 family)